jgi:hypothetical protein
MLGWPAEALTFLAAELLFLIVRSRDLTILFKRADQRTAAENALVTRGLGRSLCLEMVLFVPASAFLMVLIAPVVIEGRWPASSLPGTSLYALLGVASYGFPFAAIKTVITRVAIQMLKEYAGTLEK